MWRRRLEDRINFARKVSAPDRLVRRWRLLLVLELLLAGLTAATVFLWNRMRQRIARLQRELREQRRADHRVELRLHVEQALAIAVLLLLICEAVLMLGLGVMAIPGQVPLGIELLLQPSYAVGNFLVVTAVTLLLRALAPVLLSLAEDGYDAAGVASDLPLPFKLDSLPEMDLLTRHFAPSERSWVKVEGGLVDTYVARRVQSVSEMERIGTTNFLV